tara:strand:+ start:3916 stop:4866 length:951 start_codon:yes stop_codon:yes gene_type:complete
MDPKDINKTGFCNKQIDNIISNELKDYILKDIKRRTGKDHKHRYAKIYNDAYKKNLNNPHILCLKTFGNPYLMYCTQINNVNYCLLIDKKIKKGHVYPKMYIVLYRFSDDLFKGTLFETELVRDKSNNWLLEIGDIYNYKGNTTSDIEICDRMNIISSILENDFIDDTFTNVCPIEIKKYFNMYDTDKIKNFIISLNYKIRGFYFIPKNTTYSNILYMFTDDDINDIYSITDENKKLIFRITKTMKSDVYELYLNAKENIEKIGYAYLSNYEKSKYIKELFDIKEDINVICKFNEFFKKWEVLEETTDRINHINEL